MPGFSVLRACAAEWRRERESLHYLEGRWAQKLGCDGWGVERGVDMAVLMGFWGSWCGSFFFGGRRGETLRGDDVVGARGV